MLELKNICFEVMDENSGKRKEILRNINLNIDRNKFVVITGPNGSGKSTLAKIIMGIEKPSSGESIFNGVDITSFDVTQRAEAGIGYSFQQPVHFRGVTVRELLEIAGDKQLTTMEACDYLSQVGLCAVDYVDRELSKSLSGGEIKRIEIAMLMTRSVKLSIFDEPEAGIDLWSFHNLIEVFKKLKNQNRGSVMIISHQERILEIANEIIMLENGEVTSMGSREEMLPKLFKDIDNCDFYRREPLL